MLNIKHNYTLIGNSQKKMREDGSQLLIYIGNHLIVIR